MQSWYKKFSSQPHQPFFVSGILFFILFMMLFTASYSNILTLNNSVFSFHAYPMVFVIFIQFFLGFLFVVFPRFLTQAEIPQKDYMNQFFLHVFKNILKYIHFFTSQIIISWNIFLFLIILNKIIKKLIYYFNLIKVSYK